MRVAVIGSRERYVEHLENYLPVQTQCIISGGARGIDRCAAQHARENGLELIEYLPDYHKYGRRAPLVRNIDIIKAADLVLVFWDGSSRGTKFVIDKCGEYGIPMQINLV